MDIFWEFINSQLGIAIVLGVIGLVYAKFKKSEMYQKKLDADQQTALDAVLAAVVQMYRTIVQPAKEAAPDHKLTDQQRKAAQEGARLMATRLAAERGVNITEALGGSEMIDSYVETMVAKLKSGQGL
jgi:hypothetical protein